MEGAVAAPLMIQHQRINIYQALPITLLFCFAMLWWAAACVFYPDSDLPLCITEGYHSPSGRATELTCYLMLLALVASLLAYLMGTIGMVIGALLLLLAALLGFSEGFVASLKRGLSRPPAETQSPNDEEDVEQPLLQNTATDQPGYGGTSTPQAQEEPAAEPPIQEPPVQEEQQQQAGNSTRSTPRNTGEAAPARGQQEQAEPVDDNVSEYSNTPEQQSSKGMKLLAAVFIGIAAGIVGGIVLAVLLSLATDQ